MEEKHDILNGYKEWLPKHGVPNSSSSYKTYLKNLPLSRVCEELSAIKEGDENDKGEYPKVCRVNKVLEGFKSTDTGKSEEFINAVVVLIKGGDLLYARTFVDVLCYALTKIRAIGAINTKDADYVDFNNGRSAWRKFREYLATEFDYGYTSGIVDEKRRASLKKRIAKGMLSKIDSFDGLVLEFEKERNGASDFIRFAVEQSFFFSPKVVNDRMNDVVQSFLNGERLFARRTTDSSKKDGDYQKDQDGKRLIGCFVDKDKDLKIPVVIDTDGNKEVRRLINKYTGYTIGAGKNCIFHNFIISHLWGQAYDPRYFTNFWNIAIVPAWVNSLLDKEADDEIDEDGQANKKNKNDQGSLVKRLKDTFMNISKALYELSDETEDWKKLQMEVPSVNGSTGEVVEQQQPYRIKILCKKEDVDEALGAIEVRYYPNNGSKGKINSK